MRVAIGWIGASLWALGVPLAAQQDAAPQVFEEIIDVRVVNVEAVVTDPGGQQVRGLTVEDFQLLVDGKEVPIEYFTEIVEGTSATAEPAGAGAVSPVTVSPVTVSPVTVGEEVGRSFLIYIDEPFAVAEVRDAVLEKLERDLSLLEGTDQMALLAFDGSRIEVLSGWTGDRAALAAALAQARRRVAGGNQALAQQRKLQQDVDWVLDNAESFEADQIAAFLSDTSGRVGPEARTQLGKTAVAAAGALRGFETPPGRKVLLFVSGAWSMSVAPQLYRPMVEAANRLGYTIYPVDAAKSAAKEVSALDRLARSTGGRVAVSAKLEVFRQVVADTAPITGSASLPPGRPTTAATASRSDPGSRTSRCGPAPGSPTSRGGRKTP